MVAGDVEDAVARAEVANRLHFIAQVGELAVDEIARDRDRVGVQRVRLRHELFDEVPPDRRPDVHIAPLHDPIALELLGQILDGHAHTHRARTARLQQADDGQHGRGAEDGQADGTRIDERPRVRMRRPTREQIRAAQDVGEQHEHEQGREDAERRVAGPMRERAIAAAQGERKKRKERQEEERDPGGRGREPGRGGADQHRTSGVREEREPDQSDEGDASVRRESGLAQAFPAHEWNRTAPPRVLFGGSDAAHGTLPGIRVLCVGSIGSVHPNQQ